MSGVAAHNTRSTFAAVSMQWTAGTTCSLTHRYEPRVHITSDRSTKWRARWLWGWVWRELVDGEAGWHGYVFKIDAAQIRLLLGIVTWQIDCTRCIVWVQSAKGIVSSIYTWTVGQLPSLASKLHFQLWFPSMLSDDRVGRTVTISGFLTVSGAD